MWTLKTGSSTVEFGRSGQNDWQVLKPKPMRADGYKVEDLVRKVHDAKLNSGVSEDDEKSMLPILRAARVWLPSA